MAVAAAAPGLGLWESGWEAMGELVSHSFGLGARGQRAAYEPVFTVEPDWFNQSQSGFSWTLDTAFSAEFNGYAGISELWDENVYAEVLPGDANDPWVGSFPALFNPANVEVDDSAAVLAARIDGSFDGWSQSPWGDDCACGYGGNLTTSMIASTTAAKHGYVEVQLSTDEGSGLLTAVTLQGVSGEIALIEMRTTPNKYGSNATTISTTNYHCFDPSTGGEVENGNSGMSTGLVLGDGALHTVGVYWTATSATFYIDGVEQRTVTAITPGCFDQDMELIVSLEVDKELPVPDIRFSTPRTKIEYIRYYTKANSFTMAPTESPTANPLEQVSVASAVPNATCQSVDPVLLKEEVCGRINTAGVYVNILDEYPDCVITCNVVIEGDDNDPSNESTESREPNECTFTVTLRFYSDQGNADDVPGAADLESISSDILSAIENTPRDPSEAPSEVPTHVPSVALCPGPGGALLGFRIAEAGIKLDARDMIPVDPSISNPRSSTPDSAGPTVQECAEHCAIRTECVAFSHQIPKSGPNTCRLSKNSRTVSGNSRWNHFAKASTCQCPGGLMSGFEVPKNGLKTKNMRIDIVDRAPPRTVLGCAQACTDIDECHAFAFNSKYKSCALTGSDATKGTNNAGSIRWTYYRKLDSCRPVPQACSSLVDRSSGKKGKKGSGPVSPLPYADFGVMLNFDLPQIAMKVLSGATMFPVLYDVDVDYCANVCRENAECRAFSYHRSRRQCRLGRDYRIQTTGKNSGWWYYAQRTELGCRAEHNR